MSSPLSKIGLKVKFSLLLTCEDHLVDTVKSKEGQEVKTKTGHKLHIKADNADTTLEHTSESLGEWEWHLTDDETGEEVVDHTVLKWGHDGHEQVVLEHTSHHVRIHHWVGHHFFHSISLLWGLDRSKLSSTGSAQFEFSHVEGVLGQEDISESQFLTSSHQGLDLVLLQSVLITDFWGFLSTTLHDNTDVSSQDTDEEHHEYKWDENVVSNTLVEN